MTEVELSPKEFEALLERVGPDQQKQAATLMPAGRYRFTLDPVTFWVDQKKVERHRLQALVARLMSGWKDTLTEPTLQKLRAILAVEE